MNNALALFTERYASHLSSNLLLKHLIPQKTFREWKKNQTHSSSNDTTNEILMGQSQEQQSVTEQSYPCYCPWRKRQHSVVTLKKSVFERQRSKFREKQHCVFCIFSTEVAHHIGTNIRKFWSLPRPPGLQVRNLQGCMSHCGQGHAFCMGLHYK